MTKPKSKVLVLLAHPSLRHSHINKTLINYIENIEGITIHDLYDAYPEFYIDVKYEQQLLLQHDLIVFQHPLYWYSTTPMLKLWQDVVLGAGFAYGEGGDKLHGKHLMQVISTGGKKEAYQSNGYNTFTIKQLLAPMQATANMCGLKMQSPLVLHHSYKVTTVELANHATQYKNLLIEFTNNNALCFEKENN